MGFIVLSNHVVQNHRNLEQYFRAILTKDDIIDIKAYKKRFTYVPGFYKLFMEGHRITRKDYFALLFALSHNFNQQEWNAIKKFPLQHISAQSYACQHSAQAKPGTFLDKLLKGELK